MINENDFYNHFGLQGNDAITQNLNNNLISQAKNNTALQGQISDLVDNANSTASSLGKNLYGNLNSIHLGEVQRNEDYRNAIGNNQNLMAQQTGDYKVSQTAIGQATKAYQSTSNSLQKEGTAFENQAGNIQKSFLSNNAVQNAITNTYTPSQKNDYVKYLSNNLGMGTDSANKYVSQLDQNIISQNQSGASKAVSGIGKSLMGFFGGGLAGGLVKGAINTGIGKKLIGGTLRGVLGESLGAKALPFLSKAAPWLGRVLGVAGEFLL